MDKVFEDYFSEYQADMVSICLEYVSDRADTIYIYCSCEEKVIASDFFYRIDGKLYEKHELNDAVNKGSSGYSYNIAGNRQFAALRIINDDIFKIYELCKKFDRPMPTEMKLAYNVKKTSLDARYKYDLVYSGDPEKTADDAASEWFDELNIKNALE